jgi:hypothetical protein
MTSGDLAMRGTHFVGGQYRPRPMDHIADEIKRFHGDVGNVGPNILRNGDPLLAGMTERTTAAGTVLPMRLTLWGARSSLVRGTFWLERQCAREEF